MGKEYSLIPTRLKSFRIKDCRKNFTETTISRLRNFQCLKTMLNSFLLLNPDRYHFRSYKNYEKVGTMAKELRSSNRMMTSEIYLKARHWWKTSLKYIPKFRLLPHATIKEK